jgi:dolichol-phosphate mannosyltransferase
LELFLIFVLLPAYNEAESLPVLLPKIAAALAPVPGGYRIVVCDDGSRDATAEILRRYAAELPLDVISHRINRGLGETARDLFEFATERSDDNDVIVRLDCDDTHEPDIIHTMLAQLDRGYDVVIASRFQHGGGQLGVDAYRAVISRVANLFMKVFFPVPGVREFSCGFRAYRARILREAIAFWGNSFIQLKGLGFTGTLEKLVKLHLIGARFSEVPFVLRYDQKRSLSKMVTSVTTVGYLVMTLLYHWPWGGWRSAARSRWRAAGQAQSAATE